MSPEPTAAAAPVTGTLDVRPFAPGRVPGAGERRGGDGPDGFTTGYAVGYAEGVRRARAAVAAEQAAWRAAREAEAARDRARLVDLLLALRAAEAERAEQARVDLPSLLDVVAATAARLAHDAVLAAAPTAAALLARLERAVATAGGDGTVEARVSPAAAAVLERAGAVADGLPAGVRLVADARLSDGDVVVRAGATTVTDLLADALAALALVTEDPADAAQPAGVVGHPTGAST